MTDPTPAEHPQTPPACFCECHINADAFDMDEESCDCFQDGDDHEDKAGLNDD